MTPLVGMRVVLSGLRVDPRRPTSGLMPPRIGLVVAVSGVDIVVRLRLGLARHWSHKVRRCLASNVVRLANEREIQLGFPCGEVVAGRVLSKDEASRLSYRAPRLMVAGDRPRALRSAG